LSLTSLRWRPASAVAAKSWSAVDQNTSGAALFRRRTILLPQAG